MCLHILGAQCWTFLSYNKQVAPNGIVTNAYPPTVSLGFNLLKDPRRRENFLTTVLSPTVTLFGPVNRSFGADGSWFYALVGTYSVYIQGVDASADFHMNSSEWYLGRNVARTLIHHCMFMNRHFQLLLKTAFWFQLVHHHMYMHV